MIPNETDTMPCAGDICGSRCLQTEDDAKSLGARHETFALWNHGPVFETSRSRPVCTDSVLLADFTRCRGKTRFADLGAGTGLIGVILAYNNPNVSGDLVEIDNAQSEIALRNVKRNDLSNRLSVLTQDLRTLTGRYGLVVTNPPYFSIGSGTSPRDGNRSAAREETGCTLEELAVTAARLLGDGGILSMVYPATRLCEAVTVLSEHRLEVKRLRLVQARADKSPSVALIECRRSGHSGVTVEPALILKNPDGSDTDEVRRIYRM